MYKPRASFTLLSLGRTASARNSKITAIEDYCLSIWRKFVEAVPRYFSAPAPTADLPLSFTPTESRQLAVSRSALTPRFPIVREMIEVPR